VRVGPAVAKAAKSLRPILGEMGVGVRSDVATAPTRLVAALLRRLGLRLDERKSGATRTYVVSASSVERMTRTSSRYLARILDGGDPIERLAPIAPEPDLFTD
jgi:hypothetical protein